MPKPAPHCDCCPACYPIGCDRSYQGGKCDKLPCHCDDVFFELTDEECQDVVSALGIDVTKWAEEIRDRVKAVEEKEQVLAMNDDVKDKCTHGVVFDAEEAGRILAQPYKSTGNPGLDFVVGHPGAAEIRRRWPRLQGPCPLGCGFNGIAYASQEHFIAGDW